MLAAKPPIPVCPPPAAPRFRNAGRRRGGFTIVELLVVIAILGVLVALMLPAIQAAREAARRQNCMSNLKEVAQGIANYESGIGRYPAGRVGCDDTSDVPACPPGLPPEKKTAASALVTILPYMEQQALYQQLDVEHGGLWNNNINDLDWFFNSPTKAKAILERVPVYVCPSDLSKPISDAYYPPVLAATGTYALVQGTRGPGTYPKIDAKYYNNGMFVYVIRRRASEITDGTSHTLMVGEVVMADAWESTNTWTYARVNADTLRNTEYPLNTLPGSDPYHEPYERQYGAFGSQHPGIALFAYADGHVDVVRDDIDLATYRALSTIAGED